MFSEHAQRIPSDSSNRQNSSMHARYASRHALPETGSDGTGSLGVGAGVGSAGFGSVVVPLSDGVTLPLGFIVIVGADTLLPPKFVTIDGARVPAWDMRGTPTRASAPRSTAIAAPGIRHPNTTKSLKFIKSHLI